MEYFDSCPNDGPPLSSVDNWWQNSYTLVVAILLPLMSALVAFWQPKFPENAEVANERRKCSQRLKPVVFWNTIWCTALYYIWMLGSYKCIHAVKILMDDKLCNTVKNGISGHFFFYICVSVGFAFLIVRLSRDPTDLTDYVNLSYFVALFTCKMRFVSILTNLTHTLLVLASVFTMFNTWYFGFHTPRQIAYGSLAAFLSMWMFVLILDRCHVAVAPRPQKPQSLLSDEHIATYNSTAFYSSCPDEEIKDPKPILAVSIFGVIYIAWLIFSIVVEGKIAGYGLFASEVGCWCVVVAVLSFRRHALFAFPIPTSLTMK
eukprot:GILJ01013511.1.p1 GENE.GILJ01013511.1~~GILJ01013511.1.p1  ORF type:complete len:344 (+),score=19.09 GILJ01013511.1:81-1034(+)